MARALQISLVVVGGLLLFIVVVVGPIAWNIWYHNTFKTEVQILDVPSRNVRYMLMTDISGFEDPAWYVYEVQMNESPPKSLHSAHDDSEALFWNYDEANDLIDSPKLSVVHDRYVVFSRGGLNFSLYDIESQRVLVNESSPWGAFIDADGEAKYGLDGQAQWVRDNLHRQIEQLISAPPNNALERP